MLGRGARTSPPVVSVSVAPVSVAPVSVASAMAVPTAIATGAIATRVALRLLRTRPPGGAHRWTRTNHAGRPLTLLEGPAVVVGAAAGAAAAAAATAVAGGSGTVAVAGRRAAGAAILAAAGSGLFGLLDDLAGDGASKGLRGHLGALRSGRITTGAVKIAGLAATGAATAWVLDRGRDHHRACTLLGGAVIAGGANLANLLDLRPGRALKAVLLTGAPLALAGEPAAAAALGAAFGALRDDLDGTAMLGDTGANAAGALIGTAAVARTGPAGRLLLFAVLTALTLASERVSFTKVIESTPVLRQIDAWGRG